MQKETIEKIKELLKNNCIKCPFGSWYLIKEEM